MSPITLLGPKVAFPYHYVHCRQARMPEHAFAQQALASAWL
jgi:hypothetical protein